MHTQQYAMFCQPAPAEQWKNIYPVKNNTTRKKSETERDKLNVKYYNFPGNTSAMQQGSAKAQISLDLSYLLANITYYNLTSWK